MFDKAKAAQFFVVAWCKDWTMGQYLDVITETHGLSRELTGDFLAELHKAMPWMPHYFKPYNWPVREYAARVFPKLNTWLWSRKDDISRLSCAAQIERLKFKEPSGRVRDEDRAEMKKATKDGMQETFSYRLSRESFKTNQRSAWNVCKA